MENNINIEQQPPSNPLQFDQYYGNPQPIDAPMAPSFQHLENHDNIQNNHQNVQNNYVYPNQVLFNPNENPQQNYVQPVYLPQTTYIQPQTTMVQPNPTLVVTTSTKPSKARKWLQGSSICIVCFGSVCLIGFGAFFIVTISLGMTTSVGLFSFGAGFSNSTVDLGGNNPLVNTFNILYITTSGCSIILGFLGFVIVALGIAMVYKPTKTTYYCLIFCSVVFIVGGCLVTLASIVPQVYLFGIGVLFLGLCGYGIICICMACFNCFILCGIQCPPIIMNLMMVIAFAGNPVDKPVVVNKTLIV